MCIQIKKQELLNNYIIKKKTNEKIFIFLLVWYNIHNFLLGQYDF